MNGDPRTVKDIDKLFDMVEETATTITQVATRQEYMGAQLGKIEATVNDIQRNGCWKSAQHDEVKAKVAAMEQRGYAGMAATGGISTFVGGGITALVQWLMGRN